MNKDLRSVTRPLLHHWLNAKQNDLIIWVFIGLITNRQSTEFIAFRMKPQVLTAPVRTFQHFNSYFYWYMLMFSYINKRRTYSAKKLTHLIHFAIWQKIKHVSLSNEIWFRRKESLQRQKESKLWTKLSNSMFQTHLSSDMCLFPCLRKPSFFTHKQIRGCLLSFFSTVRKTGATGSSEMMCMFISSLCRDE